MSQQLGPACFSGGLAPSHSTNNLLEQLQLQLGGKEARLRQQETEFADAERRLETAAKELKKSWDQNDETAARLRSRASDELNEQRHALERLMEEQRVAMQDELDRREPVYREEQEEWQKRYEDERRDIERQLETEHQRIDEDAKRRDTDLERERLCRIRAEEQMQAAQRRALEVQTDVQRIEMRKDSDKDVELRRISEDQDHCKRQLEEAKKHQRAADEALAEATAAKRALETNAAEEKRKLQRELKQKESDYNALAREATRIRLEAQTQAARELDKLQLSLKTESKDEFDADDRTEPKRWDSSPIKEGPRRTRSAVRALSPKLYSVAPAYADDDDDDGSASDEEEGRKLDEGLRIPSADRVDRIAATPISPVGVIDTLRGASGANVTPQGANTTPGGKITPQGASVPAPQRQMINDEAVAPKPFLRVSGQPAISWLAYFLGYCVFKKSTEKEKLEIFGLLQRESAAEWLETLAAEELGDFESLVKAFRAAFLPVPRASLARRITGVDAKSNSK
jgi:hypothetical protein